MKLKRKTKNILITVLAVVLLAGVLLSIAAASSRNTFVATEGKKVVPVEFEFGGLSSTGDYMETKESIYTEMTIPTDGLKITKKFSAPLTYRVFFYDANGDFVEASTSYSKTAEVTSNSGHAAMARIVVTPVWDSTAKRDLTRIDLWKLSNAIMVEANLEILDENQIGLLDDIS